jgi:hypothetical protein
MAYAFVQDVASSWEQYERVTAAMVEPAPQGLILHVAGPTDEGFRIIDVWESKQAWERFQAERLAPAVAALGGPSRPEPTFRDLQPAHVVVGAIEASRRTESSTMKGAMMRTRKQRLFRWIAVGFVAAAVTAPAAQATGVSPDDRPFYRGPSEVLAPSSLSPDDRPFYRGPSEALAPTSFSPDDRPFARSVGELEPASFPVEVVVRPRGFDWEDAVIGGTVGLALALLGMGAILIVQRRRSTLRPA